MKLKPLIITVSLLGLAAVGTRLATRPTPIPKADPREGKALVASEILDQASKIKLSTGGKTVELVKKPDGAWINASYYDLPADFSRIRTLVDSLSEAKLSRLVTRSPDRMSGLSLDETSITLVDGAGKSWDLSIGREADGGGRFVRFGQETAVFVSSLTAWIDGNAKNWTDSAIVTLKPEEVQTVDVSLADGKSFVLTREKPDAEFTSGDIPKDRKLKAAQITALLSDLTALRFSDTVAQEDPEVAKANAHPRLVTLKTFAGKTVALRFLRAPSVAPATPVPSGPPVPPKENPVYVVAEGATAPSLPGRVFQVYPYTYTHLPVTREDLLETAVPEAPQRTPNPVPSSAPSRP